MKHIITLSSLCKMHLLSALVLIRRTSIIYFAFFSFSKILRIKEWWVDRVEMWNIPSTMYKLEKSFSSFLRITFRFDLLFIFVDQYQWNGRRKEESEKRTQIKRSDSKRFHLFFWETFTNNFHLYWYFVYNLELAMLRATTKLSDKGNLSLIVLMNHIIQFLFCLDLEIKLWHEVWCAIQMKSITDFDFDSIRNFFVNIPQENLIKIHLQKHIKNFSPKMIQLLHAGTHLFTFHQSFPIMMFLLIELYLVSLIPIMTIQLILMNFFFLLLLEIVQVV